jgi:hypothetical protein
MGDIEMKIMRCAIAALALLCFGTAAQAKSHLSKDEIKAMGASQVQVVYVDTAMPLGPWLDASHRAAGAGIVGDIVAQHRMNELVKRLTPYQDILTKLGIPEANYKLVQDTLAQVDWLHKTPWKRAAPAPGDTVFLKTQAREAGTSVVIFIAPRLLVSQSIDQLLLVCDVEIETVNPAGSTSVSHYDSSEFTSSLDIKDPDLPLASRFQGEDEDDEDYQLLRLFSDGGTRFQGMIGKLTPQLQSQLGYYFTGVKPD